MSSDIMVKGLPEVVIPEGAVKVHVKKNDGRFADHAQTERLYRLGAGSATPAGGCRAGQAPSARHDFRDGFRFASFARQTGDRLCARIGRCPRGLCFGDASGDLVTRGGERFRYHTRAVRGSATNPMKRDEVALKSRDLLVPILGIRRTESFIDAVWNIERSEDVRELRRLFRPAKVATS